MFESFTAFSAFFSVIKTSFVAGLELSELPKASFFFLIDEGCILSTWPLKEIQRSFGVFLIKTVPQVA